MKQSIGITIICMGMCLLPLHAMEITSSVQTSNFAFTNSGSLAPANLLYGLDFSITEQLQKQLEGKISFDSDPINGNTLSARGIFRTSFLEISAGPSFGVLNSSGSTTDVPILFQPGMGIGISVLAPGIVVATADTEFALPPPAITGGQVYLQKSELTAGFYLPNVLCTVGIKQRTNTLATALAQSRIKSITDYGFYTESFKKGSVFRIKVNFIYRLSDYYLSATPAANQKIGNLVLGGGLTWIPKNDFQMFLDGNGALYSFSLGQTVAGLDSLYFDLRLGVKMRIGQNTPSTKSTTP